MLCKNCGKEIPGDAKFCPECGVMISAETKPVKIPTASEDPKSRKKKRILRERREAHRRKSHGKYIPLPGRRVPLVL